MPADESSTDSADGFTAAVPSTADSETVNCEQYRDRPGEIETSIIIRNALDIPIYVQPEGCESREEVVSVWRANTKINVYGHRGECGDHTSCQELQDTSLLGQSPSTSGETCLLECIYPRMIRINPGATLSAGVFRSEFVYNQDGSGLGRMPDVCYGGNTPPEARPSTECDSAVPLQGSYRVTVEGATEVTCNLDPDAAPCDCAPGSDGTCVTNRGNGGGNRVVATAEMLGGLEESVLLTFSD
jgi:hypothetical protein